MYIKIKCADCGQIITNRVHLGGKDTEIEIHACEHGLLHATSLVKHPIDSEGKPTQARNYCFMCGTTVKDQKHCHDCGRRLIWPAVKPALKNQKRTFLISRPDLQFFTYFYPLLTQLNQEIENDLPNETTH